jgi:hypothetical protein
MSQESVKERKYLNVCKEIIEKLSKQARFI